MAIEIKVPDLGDGIDSGDVLSVLVKEGGYANPALGENLVSFLEGFRA